jgi:ER lumen protein retaining receptor
MWLFSILLESLTIVPQLILLQRYREVENLTGTACVRELETIAVAIIDTCRCRLYYFGFVGHYVFLLGAYRALYILNWVYRSYHEAYYKHNWIVYACGVIQTLLYVDFFYYYVQRYVEVVCIAVLLTRVFLLDWSLISIILQQIPRWEIFSAELACHV